MSRSGLFNPADYNLVANPSLPKTNSRWRLWGALVVAALACFLAWHFLRGPVRVADRLVIGIAFAFAFYFWRQHRARLVRVSEHEATTAKRWFG